MPKRKTHDEFVDELSKILPNIEVQDEYINSNTKIYVKCKNCGNSYYALPSNLLKGYNCKQCYLKSKFKTKEEYEQDVLQYNSQIKVFDDYNTRTHKNSKCTFQCITCGYMFQEIPRIFLQNKCKCSNCEHNLPFTPEEIKSKITNLNPNIILLSDIEKFTGRADCYCKICKNTWNTEISHFIYNNARCPHCSDIESGKKKRKTNEAFITQLKNKNIHKITPISNYVSVNDNILVKCDICNYIWNTKPSLLYLNVGCPKCNIISVGEYYISEILDELKIEYFTQKKFDDLLGVNSGKLSYDFYLPKYNLLLEFQGSHHDGKSPRQSEYQFKIQQEHDKRKREYAQNNGYDFLEIWYWDIRKIKEILTDKLKPSTE